MERTMTNWIDINERLPEESVFMDRNERSAFIRKEAELEIKKYPNGHIIPAENLPKAFHNEIARRYGTSGWITKPIRHRKSPNFPGDIPSEGIFCMYSYPPGNLDKLFGVTWDKGCIVSVRDNNGNHAFRVEHRMNTVNFGDKNKGKQNHKKTFGR